METTTEKVAEGGASGRNGRTRKPVEQILVKEFPALGKYRVRVVKGTKPDAPRFLDIREYAKSAEFEGFTRRGVRIALPDQLEVLRRILDEAAEL